ncbi:MAG: hypothetical protein ACE149_19920 [Armatimonadota bacterium]
MSRPYPSEIIREAESRAKRLGREFLEQLAGQLSLRAFFHTRPTPPATCWLDPDGLFNQAQMVTLSAPCVESLKAPLILRVSINHLRFFYAATVRKRADWPAVSSWQEKPATWSYELSLLADQLMDFVPWVAQLVLAKTCQDERLLLSPPDACHFWVHPNLLCDYAWTVKAWEVNEEERLATERRQEMLREIHRRNRSFDRTAVCS